MQIAQTRHGDRMADGDKWLKRGLGHRERMRQRFSQGGLDRFTDEEVVEFLLTLGTPRGDLRVAAREAIKRMGSLSAVLSASIDKLTEVPGIGSKNALYLKLVHQIATRYLRDKAVAQPLFSSSKCIFDYLFHSMRDLQREVFRVLFLNRKNRLIEERDLFVGSLTGSAVYPREVMSAALDLKAAALVFVHNHPSGEPAPSPEDQRLTRDLLWAARLLMIQVLDHIIIGHNTYYSFADAGLIRRYSDDYDLLLKRV